MRTIIGIDPPVTAAGICGIIVVQEASAGGPVHVLEDLTPPVCGPWDWAAAAVRAESAFKAGIVVEAFGRDEMVRSLLHQVGARNVRHISWSTSSRYRTQLLLAAYERKLIVHAKPMPALQEELNAAFAGDDRYPKDRLNALLTAVGDLLWRRPSATPGRRII